MARLIGYRPNEWQARLHNDPTRHKVLVAHRLFGKTFFAAAEVMFSALEENPYEWPILVLAEEDKLTTRVWNRLLSFVQLPAVRPYVLRCTDSAGDRQMLIRNCGGTKTRILAASAKPPSKDKLGIGFVGEPHKLVVVDETQFLNPEVLDLVFPAFSRSKGRAVLIGTPRGRNNLYLYWTWGQDENRQEGWSSYRLPYTETGVLDEEFVRAEWERARSEGPTGERRFRQEYLCEWIIGEGNVFEGVREAVGGELAKPVWDERCVFGIDVAESHDYNVLCIMRIDGQIVHESEVRGIGSPSLVKRFAQIIREYRCTWGYCDKTGMGGPVTQMIEGEGISVHGWNFDSANKAEVINRLAFAILKQEVRIPAVCTELVAQLEAYESKVSPSGHVRMNAPSGMHDDHVIAFALANAARESFMPDLPRATALPKYDAAYAGEGTWGQ